MFGSKKIKIKEAEINLYFKLRSLKLTIELPKRIEDVKKIFVKGYTDGLVAKICNFLIMTNFLNISQPLALQQIGNRLHFRCYCNNFGDILRQHKKLWQVLLTLLWGF